MLSLGNFSTNTTGNLPALNCLGQTLNASLKKWDSGINTSAHTQNSHWEYSKITEITESKSAIKISWFWNISVCSEDILLNLKAPIRRDGRAVLEADADPPSACNEQVATYCPETFVQNSGEFSLF